MLKQNTLPIPSALTINQKNGRRVLSINASLLALAGCGGADPAPEITLSVNGGAAVQRASVFLSTTEGGAALTMFQLSPASGRDALVAIPEPLSGENVVKDLISVSVEDGHFVASTLQNFATGGVFAATSIHGSLWLLSNTDEAIAAETIELVVNLSGNDLIIDMPSDGHSLVLEAGSQIELGGGNLIISDGYLDLVETQLIDIQNIILNSELSISVSQMAGIGGTISTAGSSVLHVTLWDLTDAELLQQILAAKTLPTGLSLALEAKTPEVAAYIDDVFFPELAETLGLFAAVDTVAGENDAPVSIELTPQMIVENVQGHVAATFSVVDVDPGDSHTITLSDARFVVLGNQILLADGVSLDFESENSVPLVITATDAGGLSVSRSIELQVLDVNEAPTELTLTDLNSTVFEGQDLTTRLLIADLAVTDDALGDTSFTISGDDAAYFEILSGQLYLKSGVLPDFSANPNLTATVTAFDPLLPESAPVSASITVALNETTTSLAAAATNAVLVTDADASNTYSAGDVITLRFNSAIDVSSFSTSDITASAGSLGDATLTALNGVNGQATEFSLTLGATSSLSPQTELNIEKYAIVDTFDLHNANTISFALPAIVAPFNIQMAYSGASAYLNIFENAISVWEQIIIADLPDVGAIDDLFLDISVEYIDGVDNVLGYAGYTHLRAAASGGLPYRGNVVLDETDIAQMPISEAIDIAIHEIAHVLGFGTLWDAAGLISVSQAAYFGENALAAYQNAGGTGAFIPLETQGGDGTAYAHWDDAVFGRELMTGYLNTGENYLSAITIGAIKDLGYFVDYGAGEDYILASALFA